MFTEVMTLPPSTPPGDPPVGAPIRFNRQGVGAPIGRADAARAGSMPVPTSIEGVYDRCAEAMYRFFLVRTGHDVHLSQDLMQQLWVAALKTGRDVPLNELEFWLRTVARRLLATHWRRAKVRGPVVSVPDPDVAAGLAQRLGTTYLAPTDLADREVRNLVLLAVTDLGTDDQTLIFAHYFEGAEHSAIADRLGISVRAVEGRLYRARQALRARLSHLEDLQ